MLPSFPLSAAMAATATTTEYDGFIGWVLSLMTTLGEVGVGAAILIETFFPPIPSEAVLPGAGFLAFEGRMSFWGAVLAATLGGIIGAWGWYAVGAAFGRDRTRRVIGKVPLLEYSDFDRADVFFSRWGRWAVLIGRCVPLVRSFISIPAGIQRMNFWEFSLYTLIGSLVWNGIWIGLGYAFGPVIGPTLEKWSGLLSNLVLVALGVLVVWFVIVRLRRRRVTMQNKAAR